MSEKEIKDEMRELGIKRIWNTKQKKAIIALVIIATAGIVGGFLIVEYNRVQNRIILATTTSTYDSGLLDILVPVWEGQTGFTVEILSVGTGAALRNGESGDADVLLVHSRSREDDFIAAGYGLYRTCVMYNDFILIGPASDPADLLNAINITDAMTRIKDESELGNANFTSRGDASGTHLKELLLWSLVEGFVPDPAVNTWYDEAGEGMGATLTIANQQNSYTLIDRGTWLANKDDVSLILVYEANDSIDIDKNLLNPYGAMLVNPLIHQGIKYEKAMSFVAFLVSEQGQKLIGEFKKEGELLFTPCFGKCNETHDCTTTEDEVEFWSQHNGGHIRTTSGPSLASADYPLYGTVSI